MPVNRPKPLLLKLEEPRPQSAHRFLWNCHPDRSCRAPKSRDLHFGCSRS